METSKVFGINVCFWETAHLPLLKANIKTYFLLWAKCQVWGGVGVEFLETYIDPVFILLSQSDVNL